jgi:hypothetical protein
MNTRLYTATENILGDVANESDMARLKLVNFRVGKH